MARLVLDTDVASLSYKGRLPSALGARIVGQEVCVTFVTVGELARWAEKRHWGTRARTELVRWLGSTIVLPYRQRDGPCKADVTRSGADGHAQHLDAIRWPATGAASAADGLVYRYNPANAPDGLPGHEGTFNMCSFWLVEALTRAGRTDPDRLEDARLLFEQMLGYANHLGLYAEQTGASGEALGNFPQAFTHLA